MGFDLLYNYKKAPGVSGPDEAPEEGRFGVTMNGMARLRAIMHRLGMLDLEYHWIDDFDVAGDHSDAEWDAHDREEWDQGRGPLIPLQKVLYNDYALVTTDKVRTALEVYDRHSAAEVDEAVAEAIQGSLPVADPGYEHLAAFVGQLQSSLGSGIELREGPAGDTPTAEFGECRATWERFVANLRGSLARGGFRVG